MIPHDRITFNDDRTEAWWLPRTPTRTTPYGKQYQDPTYLYYLDCPCDTCGGHQYVTEMSDVTLDNSCPDCIDGRHTFEIEVQQSSKTKCDHKVIERDTQWEDHERTCPEKYRVSVVLGMVLPIVELDKHSTVGRYIVKTPTKWFSVSNAQFPVDCEEITMPPAAHPGMWAVKLKVWRRGRSV